MIDKLKYKVELIPLSFDSSREYYARFKHKAGHIMHTFTFDENTPFGNLQLIFFNILEDIEHINRRIRECYKFYGIIGKDPILQAFTDIKITSHKRCVEEIVYWMRRVADRLISLHYLIYQKNKNGKYLDNILIDCIGGLKKETKNSDLIEFQNKYSEDFNFLDFLNGTSNAYKHSILNDESPSLRVGQNEPLVISLNVWKNDLSNKQSYKHDSLKNVIVGFINFYKNMRSRIEEEIKNNN